MTLKVLHTTILSLDYIAPSLSCNTEDIMTRIFFLSFFSPFSPFLLKLFSCISLLIFFPFFFYFWYAFIGVTNPWHNPGKTILGSDGSTQPPTPSSYALAAMALTVRSSLHQVLLGWCPHLSSASCTFWDASLRVTGSPLPFLITLSSHDASFPPYPSLSHR